MTGAKQKSKWQQYKELASPGKFIIALQFACYIIYYVLRAVETVFSARIIVSITELDYISAYRNLILEFIIIAGRNFFTWSGYMIYNRAFRKSFLKLSEKMITKLLNAKTSNFSETSKETIQNIMVADVDTLSCFSDSFAVNCGKAIQAVVSLIIVARAKWWVALILIATCSLNYLILRFINTRYAVLKRKQSEAKERVYESVNRILGSKEIINEFSADEEYSKKYLERCEGYVYSDKKRYTWYAFKDSWWFVIYSFGISCLTAIMIFLVSKGSITLELYLIVVPYFLTITERFNDFFSITQNIADRDVALARCNTILNFTDEELGKFGDVSIRYGGTNISLVGVSYENLQKENGARGKFYGKLDDVDISFAPKSLNIVYGDKWCGKRLIFNMLRRRIKPDSGVILLDNININDYNSKTFYSNIYYCTSHPEFIAGSIMDNFLAIEHNKYKIYQVCKQVDIYYTIMEKPKGFDAVVDESFSRAETFLIGLARALLTGCETLLIYEIPNSLTQKDKDRIASVLWQLSKTKTIVFFTHTNLYRDIAKTTYHIENGKVTNVEINDHSSFCLLQEMQTDVPKTSKPKTAKSNVVKKVVKTEKITGKTTRVTKPKTTKTSTAKKSAQTTKKTTK